MLGIDNTTLNGPGRLDEKTREALIIKYAYLVKYIAGRIAIKVPSSVQYDELVSAGCMGLINAVDRFDPSRQTDIKTYAEYRIKGAILDELRRMDWYSRSMRKKVQEIEAAVREVEAKKERPSLDSEVAEALGISLADYHTLLGHIYSATVLSLDEFLRGSEGENSRKRSFQERMTSPDDPSDSITKQELRQVVARAIATLSEKEQMVISLYYYEELTLKEIGQVLDLTESRICQIHTQTLIKLKVRLRAYYHMEA
ncbi:MAG: FliA/WhiG family RNA polymerase sigma factor [Desulfobacterales bacterium]|jgi:RNA polymerase sigma factor for flagellar operon FliA|nr:FliA/WhiG family RNA polymerase sigma factor [Desulfobacterales bacterium]